jgi:hypothetical protein
LQNQQRLDSCDDVIGHYCRAEFQLFLHRVNRKRFPDIEYPIHNKAGRYPSPFPGYQKYGDKETNDLVINDKAWIDSHGIAGRLAADEYAAMNSTTTIPA